jgi:hypothetical protein
MPWLLETFAWCPNFQGRVLVTGCNWTPSLGETFDGLNAELAERWVRDDYPVMVAVHLVYPAATFTNKGKTELALPFEIENAVIDAITKVTAVWTKQRKTEERRLAMTIATGDLLLCAGQTDAPIACKRLGQLPVG